MRTIGECLAPLPLSPVDDFAWMPDWTGETVVLVAGGPSAKDVPLVEGAGLAKFIVINTSWKLAPWADVLYGCDRHWWIKSQGVPSFPGLKVTQDKEVPGIYPEVRRVYTQRDSWRLLLGKRGWIGWAGNSGFQAFNLAVNWGAKKILLVGYDLTLAHGVHWHGRHPTGLSNPKPTTVENWRPRMDGAAETCKALGIRVINCSPISTLQNYPKMSYEEALHG